MHSMKETSMILLCVLLGAAGQIAFKVGASSPALGAMLGAGRWTEFLLRVLFSPLVLVGLTLYGISTLMWLAILSRSDLSYAYPFISIGFLVTTAFGWLALGEHLSVARLAGVILIISGVVLVARS